MIGCDIVEIERIRSSLEKFGYKFLRKVLSDEELALYNKKRNGVEFLAGRFAAKEAVAKAFGTGISKEIGFGNLEILPDDRGKPTVYIKGNLRDDVQLTISHAKSYAMAVCILRDGASL